MSARSLPDLRGKAAVHAKPINNMHRGTSAASGKLMSIT